MMLIEQRKIILCSRCVTCVITSIENRWCAGFVHLFLDKGLYTLRSTRMKSLSAIYCKTFWEYISSHMMKAFKSSLDIDQCWMFVTFVHWELSYDFRIINKQMAKTVWTGYALYIKIAVVKMFQKCAHHHISYNLSVIFTLFSVKSLQRWTSITLEVVSGRCQLF